MYDQEEQEPGGELYVKVSLLDKKEAETEDGQVVFVTAVEYTHGLDIEHVCLILERAAESLRGEGHANA